MIATKSFVRLSRRILIILCFAGLIGLAANQIFLFTGLKYSSATNASLIFSFSPLITAILAAVFLKEQITNRMVFGSLIAILGIYFVLSVKGHFVFNIGDLFLFSATATFSCNLILVSMLSKQLSTFIITTYSFMISAIIIDPFVLTDSDIEWNHSISIWLLAAASVIVGQGITTSMWNNAMNDVGPAKSAIVLNLQPLITMFLDYWINHNTVTVQQIAGATLVFSGIILGIVQKGARTKKLVNTAISTMDNKEMK